MRRQVTGEDPTARGQGLYQGQTEPLEAAWEADQCGGCEHLVERVVIDRATPVNAIGEPQVCRRKTQVRE